MIDNDFYITNSVDSRTHGFSDNILVFFKLFVFANKKR